VTLAAVGGAAGLVFLLLRPAGPEPRPGSGPRLVEVHASAGAATAAPSAPLASAAPSTALAAPLAITAEVKRLLDSTTDLIRKRSHEVKPPYPWRVLPDRYRALVRAVRGRPDERAFWLDHSRVLAVPSARLSSAVAKDPDNPDAPTLLTVDTENARGNDFDATVRQVAGVVRGGRPGSGIHMLMEAFLLMVSGDTQAATRLINGLPPLPETGENRLETVARHLARGLLAYGVKKGSRPIEWTRKGLAALAARLDDGPTVAEWEWALILAYSTIPSFFHEDHGKREAGRDVVERGLALIGRGPRGPRVVPAGVDRVVLQETRLAIRDAARRASDILGPDLNAQPPLPPAERALGTLAARWMVTACNDEDEGRLWYGVYLGWLVPGRKVLARRDDPTVGRELAELDRALSDRQASEKTGVMSGCRARLAQIRGDAAAAERLLAQSAALARKAGYEEKDETVWEALDRFRVELRASGP
jgi:hypothetical protein